MPDTVGPQISVVIPTVGRPTLRRAIDSALAQTYPPLEVIVVFDLERLPEDLELPERHVRAIVTGGRRGASTARELGIESSCGDAIALLDDDDLWFESKLEAQAALIRNARDQGFRAIVSTGVQVIDPDGRALYTTPRRRIAPGQSLSEYLFTRKALRWGEATMSSSTLLIDRDLLRQVSFDSTLPVHEDWDWLMRAGRRGDVRFLMAPGLHAAYTQKPRGTRISSSPHWRGSVTWADQNRDVLSARQYGDFLLGISVTLAVDAGARKGAFAVAYRGLRRGRPGLPAILVATALLLLPRRGPTAVRRLLSVPKVWLRRLGLPTGIPPVREELTGTTERAR